MKIYYEKTGYAQYTSIQRDYDSGFIALELLNLGFEVEFLEISAYKGNLSVEKLVEPHTEKHRQTASALLCGRQGQRSTQGHREVKGQDW